jgi:hypothetical protein
MRVISEHKAVIAEAPMVSFIAFSLFIFFLFFLLFPAVAHTMQKKQLWIEK